jgi:hypothetical protein
MERDLIVNAGTINIQLEKKPALNAVNAPCDLKQYTSSTTELNKLDLITRLERSQTILTSCLIFNPASLCFTVQIQVLCYNEPNDNLGNEGHYFLDLMLLVNRSPIYSQDNHFLSVFGDNVNNTATRSLLDIFIHLPSPHIDSHLSDWCDNKDILGFLNEDIQVEIPGMKTRLYTYQKVRNSIFSFFYAV